MVISALTAVLQTASHLNFGWWPIVCKEIPATSLLPPNLAATTINFVKITYDGMTTTYSNDAVHIARLTHVEQQIIQNKLQDAAQQLNLLVKASPKDPRVFLLGARLAEAAHNPGGVLQAAVKAYQLAPQWPVASLYLAGVLADRGQTVESMTLARQAVQQATSQKTRSHELLVKAAEIAHRLGQYPKALTWLRLAETLKPNDTGIRYKLGLTLSASGDFAGAIRLFTNLLSQLTDNPTILIARRQAALAAQNTALAVQDGETLLAQDPANEEHQFYLAIARGETPTTQPASVITLQFDSVASQYDAQHATAPQNKLQQDVAQLIRNCYPNDDADVLDLGCGTGLLGVALGPMKGVLVGVDLSGQMLAQAAPKQLYDKFHAVNLLDALRETPADQYHVITALDVFGYVGDLTTVAPNALRILLPGGRFVFSCEASAEDDPSSYRLNTSLRYTHQRVAVQRLLEDAGFKDIEIQEREIGLESAQPVAGFLVSALKPVPVAKKTTPRKRAIKKVSAS